MIKFPLFIVTLLLTVLSFKSHAQQCQPQNLLCEYMPNPIGIDATSPRLKWVLEDNRQGAAQQAYQIFVGTDSLSVIHGEANIWNTQKKVGSGMLVTYYGKPLTPFTKYYWAVKIWDKDGKVSQLSKVVSFETGMMQMFN